MIVVGVTVGAMLLPSVTGVLGWAPSAPAPSYAVGEKIDVGASLYDHVGSTVLLFARSSCSACQRSKLTMAALVKDLSQRQGVTVLLVTPAGAPGSETSFGKDIGIDQSRIVPAASDTLRIRHIPAVVVVDNTGTVLFTREGVLTEADRRDVTRLANGLSPPDAKTGP